LLYSRSEVTVVSSYPTPELFRSFPELRERLPWVPLARPTPVERLGRLESFLHSPPLWVKRDDRTSDLYGGAEARKLEFAFGALLRHGARRVVAFGPVGSGHCLAVTVFAHHFKIRPLLALVRQRETRNAQRSLQIEHDLGAELHRLDAGPKAFGRLVRSVLGRGAEDDAGLRERRVRAAPAAQRRSPA
jgi:1-aminocyclopropane-1-carboxylate deaminase/D-cysteine desulfhydrase-like pyridoxal-dependent ACC family enzyme